MSFAPDNQKQPVSSSPSIRARCAPSLFNTPMASDWAFVSGTSFILKLLFGRSPAPPSHHLVKPPGSLPLGTALVSDSSHLSMQGC